LAAFASAPHVSPRSNSHAARPREGQRVRDGLVLADGPPEYDPLPRVRSGSLQRDPPDPDRLAGDEDALGIERVQQMVEPPPHLAHHVLVRHPESIDDELVGIDGRPAELLDLPDLHGGRIEIGDEEGEPVELPRAGRPRGRRPREQ
jgi:hypothetical protein